MRKYTIDNAVWWSWLTHRILIPTFAGSSPATVAKYPEVQGGGETEKVLQFSTTNIPHLLWKCWLVPRFHNVSKGMKKLDKYTSKSVSGITDRRMSAVYLTKRSAGIPEYHHSSCAIAKTNDTQFIRSADTCRDWLSKGYRVIHETNGMSGSIRQILDIMPM